MSKGKNENDGQAELPSAPKDSGESESTSAASGNEHISKLTSDAMSYIGEFLTPEEEARFRATKPASTREARNRSRIEGISPPLTTFFVPPERTANYLVLTGRPEYLIRMLEKNPFDLFEQYPHSIDAAGQEFFNVSPADLISFICDEDMQYKVHAFAQSLPTTIKEEFFAKWHAHFELRGRGGADLVMVTGAQLPQYDEVLRRNNSYHQRAWPVEFEQSLLENPDGIICWKAPDEQLHWFYANRCAGTINPVVISCAPAQQEEYEAFKSIISNMEPFSARRSSNQEHALIKAIMTLAGSGQPISPVREGIKYRQDGIDYVDTHYDFNRLINAYHKCMRLKSVEETYKSHIAFRNDVGHAQSEVMWLIQRFCEKNRNFHEFDDTYKNTPFIRSTEFKHLGAIRPIFDVKTGLLCPELGVRFALSRSDLVVNGDFMAIGSAFPIGLIQDDLIAILRFVNDARQNIRLDVISSAPSPGTAP